MTEHRVINAEAWKHEDGKLKIADWAEDLGDGKLQIKMGDGPSPMIGTSATAWELVSAKGLGVDHISVPAGAGFPPHTHPGDHLLIIISGRGTITIDARIYPTRGGQVYFVPGDHPHAVGAIEEHHILAVGMPHRGPEDPDRMHLVEYKSIATELGELECGVCGAKGLISEIQCEHLPIQG